MKKTKPLEYSREILGETGFKISVTVEGVDRELTDSEQTCVSRFIGDLQYQIIISDEANNPENIKRVAESKAQILALFPDNIYVEEIQNEYSVRSIEPWYVITTNRGRFKVGRRKRVLNIDWLDTNIKADGQILFAHLPTTVGSTYIHAWSNEQASEFVNTLLAAE